MNYSNFEDLTKEHDTFLEFLSRAAATPPSKGALEKFLFLLHEVHHRKEEEILFPLFFSGASEPSGPKCATFFPPRWMNSCSWQDSFHALNEYLGPEKRELAPSRRKIFSSPSMLKIPVEDHILGERAAERMRAEPGRIPEIFPKFSALLRDHIQREGECLFELLRATLSPAQKDAYAAAAAELDRRAGTAELLRQLTP